MSIKIYVEGGGNQDRANTLCRKAFSQYFQKIAPENRMPRIMPCGTRKSAYDDFCTALRSPRDNYEVVLLLVDSEDPVQPGRSAWQHLKSRAADNWDRPASANDAAAHLMVQSMESWLLADKDTLSEFYGQGFLRNSLPQRADVEAVNKHEVIQALKHASKDTTKGSYQKTEHGYALLGLILPGRVGAASRHANRLNEMIANQNTE